MNKILFIISDRVHLARQQKLLDCLGDSIIVEEVKIETNTDGGDSQMDMDYRAAEIYFKAGEFIRKHNPDIILIRGDRFTELATATVATYLGKIIAQIEGGDISSSIDNHVRHSISKLSHLHFPTNYPAYNRLRQMGECPPNIFDFGSLDCEFAVDVKRKLEKVPIHPEPFILVLHHEMKSEIGSYQALVEELEKIPVKKLYVKSNNDFVSSSGEHEFSPEKFLALLYYAKCAVGNSSSFIKEASVLGTPVVLVGNRQEGRLKPSHILESSIGDLAINIESQLKHGRYNFCDWYYKSETAQKMAEVLKTIQVPFQKKFYD